MEKQSNNCISGKRLCIVVVLYNPTFDQLQKLNALSASGIKILAIDNSPSHVKIPVFFDYYPLYDNRGIAAAQNVGITEAIIKGYEYVVFFDQDSRFDNSYLIKIYQEYLRIKKRENFVATIGPVVIDKEKNVEYKNTMAIGKDYQEVTNVISSGSIVSTETFKEVGLYEEKLFIDLVDSEWCMRAKSKGFKTFMTRNVKLYHKIGVKYLKIGPLVCGISAPGRYYYQYRNAIWLLSRKYVPARWKYRVFARRLLDMIIYPILSDDGFEVLRNMLMGIRDGIKGS